MSRPVHTYPLVSVNRVIDGDTVDLTIDLGFYLHFSHRFRVVTVDTPERSEKIPWAHAKDFTYAWLYAHLGHLAVTTHKADSFGRWLADIYDTRTGESLAAALLQAGHAVPFVP